jgi:PST family polysaccharide transporter
MAQRIDYFSDESLRGDLKGKTVRGGAYTLIAQVGQLLLQMAALPILARLLTPADFGLVAMVTVITNFAAMFVDAGLSMATVQRPNITREEVTNLFWVATGLGALIALVVAALSPAIAWFFHEPRLVPVTLALTLSLFLAGLTIQPSALLRRGMQFWATTAVQLVSMFCGQAVAVLWAWYYRDYWAIVWAPVTTALVRAIGTWLVCDWRPGLPHWGTNIRPMVGFGMHLTTFNFVNYFSRNMDYILIGWYWGETLLGFYERAYKILMQPLLQTNAPMSAVAVPALSRLADNPERYRSFWRKGCSIAAFLQVPVVIWLALVAPELVRTLMGNQWEETIQIFWGLTPAMLISFTAPATSWVFVSWGRPDKQTKVAIVTAIITLLFFIVALPMGVRAMAWSYSINRWLIRWPVIAYCFAGTPLRYRDLWEALRSPIYATAGAAACALTLFATVPIAGPPYVQLIVKSIAFVVPFVVFSLLLTEGRLLWLEVLSMFYAPLRARTQAESEG